ncbi:MAG: nicotinate-nucleotide--dimethylbenzimidazole phosphoribosyltransferase [Burkholderiaceae bacterium]
MTKHEREAADEEALAMRVWQALERKTKPPRSLGHLETLAVRLAVAVGSERPRLVQPQLVVFAADHGVTAHGVSAYPRAVTAQMVRNMLAGGAAVSVLARQHALALTVVDCGVDAEFESHPSLRVLKVCRGSADFTREPALTTAQCEAALRNGARLLEALPGNALLLGEMGIGNTTAAAALMARLTGLPLEQCVGRGTGIDDAALAHKRALIAQALAQHAAARAPFEVLAALGGAEIATMTGAVLAAARARRLIVVDGFIATAAVAVAAAHDTTVLRQCVFAHASAERGHRAWLDALGAEPLLNLDLRLGEGSGAALAWPLLQSACLLLAEMATFEQAGVSDRV